MITLYGSGPLFGLPDPSPFVTKAEVLLKQAKLEYRTAEMSFSKAPKNKIPYIEDEGLILGDSTFIRFYLEKKYGADFTGGYGAREQAISWSLERLLEEHLYWLLVHDRWMDDGNFRKETSQFFLRAPAPIRPFVKMMVRRQVRKALHAQGLGRHNAGERLELGKRDIDAVAELLGKNRYILGERPCGADATAYPFMLGTLCPLFDSDIRRYAESKANIVNYVARMKAAYHSEI
ncbi:MAG: glutathione S-transferase C-terminal domain-containing protein [Aestuariivirga sp.]